MRVLATSSPQHQPCTPAMHLEGCDLRSEDPQTLLCIPLVTSQHPAQGWAAADCPSNQLLSQHPALWMETPKALHPK